MKDKNEFANAVATLMCLDGGMEKDLMTLQTNTLVKMYNMYIINAREANDRLERELERVHNAYKQKPAPSRHKSNGESRKRRA